MSESKARPWLKYAVTGGVCFVIGVLYFFSKIPLSEITNTPMFEILRNLSDACLIPGMLTLMVGMLFWVSSQGALDGLSYLGSYMGKVLTGRRKSIEQYGEYVQRKRENRKVGFGFFCVVGGTYLVLAVVFWGLFYLYY